jgi:hypothetical protein
VIYCPCLWYKKDIGLFINILGINLMKCIQFTDPRSVNGKVHTLIRRVNDQAAERLVQDPINRGLRKYTAKKFFKQQQKGS